MLSLILDWLEKWRLPLGVATILIMVAIPARAIWQAERVLWEGEAIRMELSLLDPYNPFRGRYLILSFDALEVPYDPADIEMSSNQFGCVHFKNDARGFARPVRISQNPPASGAYLRAQVGSASPADSLPATAWVSWPFEDYYLNETLAPAAEQAYAELVGQDTLSFYAQIRILKGQGRIEGLYVEDERLEDYLRRTMP